MTFASVRRFIVYKQHVFLFAEDLCFHNGMDVLLPYMPNNQIFLLLNGEICFYQQVQLGEIEVIFLAFIPEHTQQPAVQRDKVDLWPASANVENTVLQQLPGLLLRRQLEESHTQGDVKSRPQFLSAYPLGGKVELTLSGDQFPGSRWHGPAAAGQRGTQKGTRAMGISADRTSGFPKDQMSLQKASISFILSLSASLYSTEHRPRWPQHSISR